MRHSASMIYDNFTQNNLNTTRFIAVLKTVTISHCSKLWFFLCTSHITWKGPGTIYISNSVFYLQPNTILSVEQRSTVYIHWVQTWPCWQFGFVNTFPFEYEWQENWALSYKEVYNVQFHIWFHEKPTTAATQNVTSEYGTICLIHWGMDKMATISQTTF